MPSVFLVVRVVGYLSPPSCWPTDAAGIPRLVGCLALSLVLHCPTHPKSAKGNCGPFEKGTCIRCWQALIPAAGGSTVGLGAPPFWFLHLQGWFNSNRFRAPLTLRPSPSQHMGFRRSQPMYTIRNTFNSLFPP